MTITSNLRKMLHRKAAEYCSPNPAGNTVTGGFVVSDKSNLIPSHDIAYYVGGASAIWNYSADEDAWAQLPSSGVAGTFGLGSCGEFRAIGMMGGAVANMAQAGSTNTVINTALSIVRELSGCEVRVIDGAGSGYQGVIQSVTLGTNSAIMVTPASAVPFDTTTQFQVYSGSLWFFNAGTVAVGFSVYDRATNAWSAKSVVGLPTAWGSDGQLVSTPGRSSGVGANGFVNGTASSASSSAISDSTMNWPVDGWKNFQVRVISGTGKGQIRTISTNTGTSLTTASAWTTQPDTTSVYRIEGNDDYFYLLGNTSSTMYRYSISANAWITVAPTAVRAAAVGGGFTADWIDGVKDAEWNDGRYTPHYGTLPHQNGRYIYSFRAGATNQLDIYDIASNAWYSAINYGGRGELFTGGTCSVDLNGMIYIQKDNSGRILRFDVAKNVLDPFTLNPVPQATATAGDKMFITTFSEGATDINFLYSLGHTRNELTRWLIV